MTRSQLSEMSRESGPQECVDCRTVAPARVAHCAACGGELRSRTQSRFAYDAMAVFIGVVAVILFWIGRG